MISIAIGSAAAKSLAAAVGKRFGKSVLERWTRYRAECFLESFVTVLKIELASGAESKEVDGLLDAILQDELKSELLYDSYRKVCFSTSKTLGPRVIGLLTGQLVCENRMADQTEESIFAAAEVLSDSEMIEFAKDYHQYRSKAKGVTDRTAERYMLGESVVVRWAEDASGADALITKEHQIGALDFEEALGRWAVKLKDVGLLTDRVVQRLRLSQTRSSDAVTGFETTVTTIITFYPGCVRLNELIYRSLGTDSEHV